MTDNEKLAAICKDVVLAAFDSTADCDVGLSELRDAMEEIEWQEVFTEAFRTPQVGDAEQVKEAAAKLVEEWEGDLDYTDDLAAAIRAMPLPTTGNERVLREAFEVIPCVNADGHRTSWDICYPPEPDASGVGVVASCYGTFEQAHTMAAALNTKGAKP